MKSSPTSPESEVNLKQSLKNFKREFEEHKETLLKLKEERVSLVIEVAELKQTIKDIQESTKVSKEKAKESPQKSPKDIFSVVKSLAKALSVSKNTNEASNTDNPPAERPSTVVISHKYSNKTETWTSATKTKRKFSSPLSSSELSSSTSTIPTEKRSPQKTKIAFVTKGVVRKRKKKLSYSWYRDKKKNLEKIGRNPDESKIKKSGGPQESQ